MQINIEIVGEVKTNSMGKYSMIELAYKDLKDGKVNGRKVPDFTIQEGKSVLTGAKHGDKLTITMQKEAGKDGKEYWQWKKIAASDNTTTPQASAGHAAPKSNYETPEERKQRQDFIIRQSSLASAISMLSVNPGKDKIKREEVADVAEYFVKFVYGKIDMPTAGNFDNISDDIPM